MTLDDLLGVLRRQVRDERVLAAIAAVPREDFVPAELRGRAYENEPLPIGGGQTISQPLVVAHMLELVDVRPGDRALDVGTGSGWHAALLAELGATVTSIERDPALAQSAAARLAGRDVRVLVGDGAEGDPDRAPFDVVNVAASAAHGVPEALEAQLAPGGRLVVPVGERLVLVRRDSGGVLERRDAGGVRFVPLVGH